MHVAPRDERRAEREAAAQRWAQWLHVAMERAQVEPNDLVAAGAGRFDRATVAHWHNGDATPGPDSAVLIARVLEVSPVEVLRAAGFEEIADALAASQSVDLDDLDRHIGERRAAAEPDPVFATIYASDLGPEATEELVTARVADLNRLEQERRAAEELMLAVVSERIARDAAGPTISQVRAAKAEISDEAAMNVWEEFLDRVYAKSLDAGSLDLLQKFLADTWKSVLIYRKVQRDGPPPREERVSGEDFIASWQAAHPGQKLAA